MPISMRELFRRGNLASNGVSYRTFLLNHSLNVGTGLREADRSIKRPPGGGGKPRIKGPIVDHWAGLGNGAGPLGSSISGNIKLPAGEIIFFKYGCLWTGGSGKVFYGDFDMPLLGQPKLYSLQAPSPVLKLVTRNHHKRNAVDHNFVPALELKPQAVPSREDLSFLPLAFEDRFFLRAIGDTLSDTTLVPIAMSGQSDDCFLFDVPRSELGRLRDRQLYDIVLRVPGGEHLIIAPHSVYATTSTWENFSFIHVTDIHVAKRIDTLHMQLKRFFADGKLKKDDVDSFHNWNDNFRSFVGYANQLHARKEVDFILATGDLVDYIFEGGFGDHIRAGGGNFEFFKSLVLGEGTASDGTKNEELRVPLFTTLGNHDYRPNPYRLIAKVELSAEEVVLLTAFATEKFGLVAGLGTALLGLIKEEELKQYGNYNLTKDAAKLLEGMKPVEAKPFTSKTFLPDPRITAGDAAKMIEIDDKMKKCTAYYFREIARNGSYSVDLGGRHRVVMVNTKFDSGVTTDLEEAFMVYLANYLSQPSTKRGKFAAGFVDSEGFAEEDIKLVKDALNETAGLVIVGMHAPPLAHYDGEFSHFFRETEHEGAEIANTIDFLLRNGRIPPFTRPLTKDTVLMGAFARKIRDIKPEEIRGWRVDGTKFFRKATNLDNSLAKGVANGSDDFLKLCVGNTVARKLNLVLCGHGHDNVEYRLGRDPEKDERLEPNRKKDELQFEYFMDFYTENPERYYSSREFTAGDKDVSIQVKAGLAAPGPLRKVEEQRRDAAKPVEILQRRVPQNVNSLDRSSDARSWWESHSPLIVQTASLGPTDKNQRHKENLESPLEPAFQGIRLIDVQNDVIRRIRLVKRDEIRQEANLPSPNLESPDKLPIGPGIPIVAPVTKRSRSLRPRSRSGRQNEGKTSPTRGPK